MAPMCVRKQKCVCVCEKEEKSTKYKTLQMCDCPSKEGAAREIKLGWGRKNFAEKENEYCKNK